MKAREKCEGDTCLQISGEAPFPWFGGKRQVASLVWARFGDIATYVEPFFGSGAVLLKRPEPFTGTETVNDADGMLANFWRAIQIAPEETAQWADNPVNENDLHARHAWLLKYRDVLPSLLEGDPEWCDPKVAGWWCWGLCCWIGGDWCFGRGPWQSIDGRLVNTRNDGQGVNRKRVHLGDSGQGVNRQLMHLGQAGTGQGIIAHSADIYAWFAALSARLKRVRVCCGDWSRVCGPSVTFKHGIAGVFLDPPYGAEANRTSNIYRCDSLTLAAQVREWALEMGQRSDMRIALCGYEGEHDMPDDWECIAWKAPGGYEGQGKERSGNCKRERIWFSPACVKERQASLFDTRGTLC